VTGAANGNGSGETTLAWLRQRHGELARDRTMDYSVPGYDGRLAIRFGPVPWRAIAKVQSFTPGDDPEGRALLGLNCDVIIAATRAVLIADVGGELVDIDPEGPVGIDQRLAELLGAEAKTARETLLWLFPSEVALGVCAGELLGWTQRTNEAVNQEFVSG
jgi:hypothetical protein